VIVISSPKVSVIIPTYNRKWFLLETLSSLSKQSLNPSDYEVIIVDDGSTESVQDVIGEGYPFRLRYIYQTNKGDAEARNTGAMNSTADLLVFLDDDIVVAPGYLKAIVSGHNSVKNRIIVGTETLWTGDGNPLEQDRLSDNFTGDVSDLVEINFTEVCSNNLSIGRTAYISIGFMDNLDFPGSSMWCDVDFSYRAFLTGFEFYRDPNAICWHRDYVAMNLQNQNRRWREAAYRAASLFQKHPELINHLPMFTDKTPVDWRSDSPEIVLRKITRQAVSSKPSMWMLESIESLIAGGQSGNIFLPPIHRWIIGGYIYQGYQDGLRKRLDSGFDDNSSEKITN
jgi:glycosyltransferase involved in cell wall biosynthesis